MVVTSTTSGYNSGEAGCIIAASQAPMKTQNNKILCTERETVTANRKKAIQWSSQESALEDHIASADRDTIMDESVQVRPRHVHDSSVTTRERINASTLNNKAIGQEAMTTAALGRQSHGMAGCIIAASRTPDSPKTAGCIITASQGSTDAQYNTHSPSLTRARCVEVSNSRIQSTDAAGCIIAASPTPQATHQEARGSNDTQLPCSSPKPPSNGMNPDQNTSTIYQMLETRERILIAKEAEANAKEKKALSSSKRPCKKRTRYYLERITATGYEIHYNSLGEKSK